MLQKSVRVLIFIDWYLPGTNSGGPVRSIANLVDQLPEVDFYVLTRNSDYCSIEEYPNITSKAWNRLGENVHVYYLPAHLLRKEVMVKLIEEVSPDCLYVSGIYSPFFSQLPVDLGRKLGIRTIVSPRGMLSPHALAVKWLKKRLFLLYQNTRRAYKDVEFHVTSGAERLDVQNNIGKFVKSHLIGNLPRQLSSTQATKIVKSSGELKLVCVARIAPEKGILEGIMALQQFKHGNISLDLYGTRYNDDYLVECEEAIKRLPKNVRVKYCGIAESEKVFELLQKYHFLYLPSEGENYGHSIVESFFAGRPVIIRDKTPWKNLELQKVGFDVELEKLPFALEKALQMDQSVYDKIANNTARYILEKSQLEKTKDQYIHLFSNQNSIK